MIMDKETKALLKKEKYAYLLLIYGKILTKTVYSRMESFYLDDYSITEIAQNYNVSRNAVFESIEHGSKKLDDLEKKLGLYEKNKRLSSLLEQFKAENDSKKKDEIIKTIEGELNYGI